MVESLYQKHLADSRSGHGAAPGEIRMYNDDGPREAYEVTCAECGVETTVPFKPTGDRPVKCRDCFQKGRPPRGGGFRDRGPREEFEVTCAECGTETTVPFKPTGERPVLCRDCFRNSAPPRGGGGRGGGGGGFNRPPREMHPATCSRCGANTEVPFRPSPGRDVLCADCFRR